MGKKVIEVSLFSPDRRVKSRLCVSNDATQQRRKVAKKKTEEERNFFRRFYDSEDLTRESETNFLRGIW